LIPYWRVDPPATSEVLQVISGIMVNILISALLLFSITTADARTFGERLEAAVRQRMSPATPPYSIHSAFLLAKLDYHFYLDRNVENQ
jgi:hypothetical protein